MAAERATIEARMTPNASTSAFSSWPGSFPTTDAQPQTEPRVRARTSWHRASDVTLCVAQVIAKSVSYPDGDPATFARIESALGMGLAAGLRRAPVGDLCQALRAVLRCPSSELMARVDGEEWGSRLMAVARVLRDYGSLNDSVFDEISVGLISWRNEDRRLIAETLNELLTK